MPKISKHSVDRLHKGTTLWDSELKGFGCRRLKSGVASYILKYRIGRRQRWFTIGQHGNPWTPDTARKRAVELLLEIGAGIDPAGDKSSSRKAATVAEFAERYRTDWIAIHLKPSSQKTVSYNLKNHVVPKLGSLSILSLERSDVERVHRAMKSTPTNANRVVALVSHLCTMAEEWGVRPQNSNPCKGIKRYKEKARHRYLSQDEWTQLGKALRDAEGNTASKSVVSAIRLLALTGARLNEVFCLRWKEVDLERHLLMPSDSKTG